MNEEEKNERTEDEKGGVGRHARAPEAGFKMDRAGARACPRVSHHLLGYPL